MESPKMYIARANKVAGGEFAVGDVIEISEHFKGAYYKDCKGIEDYGKPRVYVETFPEAKAPNIFFPPIVTRETTDVTLTLYFFDIDNHVDRDEAILAIDSSYHSFVDYITGSYIKYWDEVRMRKAMLAYQEATKPTVDSLYGVLYKEVGFKFTNIYGQSFPLDSTEF